MSKAEPCDHDDKYLGVWCLPKGSNGCVACAFENTMTANKQLELVNAELVTDLRTVCEAVMGWEKPALKECGVIHPELYQLAEAIDDKLDAKAETQESS